MFTRFSLDLFGYYLALSISFEATKKPEKVIENNQNNLLLLPQLQPAKEQIQMNPLLDSESIDVMATKALNIIKSARKYPISFQAIQGSRLWARTNTPNPRAVELRIALNYLANYGRILGNEYEGFRLPPLYVQKAFATAPRQGDPATDNAGQQ